MVATEDILGNEKLTAVFGYWPSFHDAEVLWLRLDRQGVGDGRGPTLEAVIHAFEITPEVGPDGYYVLRHHVLVHLRFHDVVELRLDGFNQQNALFGLSITDLTQREWEHVRFEVSFDSSFGVGAAFQCHEIEVVTVTACDKNGVAVEA
jgi:hypothetical protein